jgi:hypothetical protein
LWNRYSERRAPRAIPGAQFAFKDLMIHGFCNSHYVSHFAAFFIVTGTKISIAKSCSQFRKFFFIIIIKSFVSTDFIKDRGF